MMHKYDLRYVYNKPNKFKTIYFRTESDSEAQIEGEEEAILVLEMMLQLAGYALNHETEYWERLNDSERSTYS